MKTQIVIWGTGRIASEFENFIDYDKTTVIAYVDNNKNMWGRMAYTKQGYVPVISPNELSQYMMGNVWIAVASSYYEEIEAQLKTMNIPNSKVIDCYHTNNIKKCDNELLKNILKSNYFKGEKFYDIEGFQLKLSSTHRLQEYKRKCLLYNAFVPYLAQLEGELGKGKKRWIIDIGANVGDTSLGMIKYTSADILAVEPTESYYSLMLENLKKVDIKYSERIRPVQAYISDRESSKFVSLAANGTAVAVQSTDDAGIPTISIKRLIDEHGINMDDVGMIKVDTDGFDADCIMSCGESLKASSPILYYENQVDTKEQYDKYICLCDYLAECDYMHYFVFDNFGNYIGCMDNEAVKDINRYLATINSYWSPRTFYYIDILCCKADDRAAAKRIIKKYQQDYPIDRHK